ncbi:PaaI family thioesterase [Winogradskyella aurantia]|uniref:Thioesterase n=1 Tax=Winogradskyella aurantia TaxID=1915063 RepID=A0A265UXE3_9FLAO|nr:hotdog fold thioesterase [Winogradskyella aurantia]OZV69980.1 thioesterase [Winogradskyella aurantia]
MQKSKEDFLAQINAVSKNTLMETLDIEIVDFGDDYLIARMPVTNKVHQPDGILHGGATAALAESVGSFASHIFIDTDKFFVRGLEITANHLKSVKSGFVYAKATFLHKGRTTQLLDIKITDEADTLISICRLSTISLPKAN